MDAAGIARCVLHSTLAVYGEAAEPSDESTPPAPINPSGASRLEGERVVREADTGSMARTFVEALRTAEALGTVERLDPVLARFAQGFDASDLRRALEGMRTPGAQRMLQRLREVGPR